MKTFSLRPIQEAVRKQIQTTGDILEIVEMLISLQDSLDDKGKNHLQMSLNKLCSVSGDLMECTENTLHFMHKVAEK